MTKRASVAMGVVWACAGLMMSGAGKPTMSVGAAQVQALYDAGKYQPAITRAQEVLGKPGMSPEDRHIVMVLAAESHLQLKQNEMAMNVLEAAHKEAVKEDRVRDAAETEAFVSLIRQSPDGVYAGQYHIVQAEERHKAYAVMFEERRKHLEEMRDAAAGATTLQPIDDMAKEFPNARELEVAATGDLKQSNALANQIENRAAEIISGILERDDQEIARIQKDSNIHAAGINDGDRARLHEMLTECEGMGKTTNQLAEVFRRPWPQPKLLAKAKDTSNRVSAMLEQNRKVGNGKG
jgi:hypothetical protein